MRKPGATQIVAYSVIAVLYLVISLLFFFLLRGEGRRSSLLLEHEAERTVSDLLESYRGRWITDALESDSRILGFGIYDSGGDRIDGWGRAPALVDPDSLSSVSSRFTYLQDRKSLILMRRIGLMPGMRYGQMGQMMRRHNMAAFLFLEFDIARGWGVLTLYNLASLLMPFLLLGVAAVIVALYRRNRVYRARLATQEQLVRLGEAARTLSHEIKNPLGAIRIQTGYLKKVLPADTHGELAVIEEEVQRLDLLTQRVGDFLRDPRGEPENVDMDPFLRGLLKRFEGEISYANRCQKTAIARFDRERLRSVLENLIQNALESREDPGGHTRVPNKQDGPPVAIDLSETQSRLRLRVLDRGKGLPQEAREKIFDPFFTSKTTGSGIGLSISKRFVEAAGGELVLAARAGGGTEATILFESRQA